MARGFLYLVVIMDWVSRAVLAWRLSNTLGAEFCVEALDEALSRHGRPEIFNTDQGSQFTSDDFTGTLQDHKVTISMDGKGRYMDNIFVERLWRSLKYEEVYLNAGACPRAGRRPDPGASVAEAKAGIDSWLGFYNEERQHQSLGYRTPRQAYEAECPWICGRSAPPVPSPSASDTRLYNRTNVEITPALLLTISSFVLNISIVVVAALLKVRLPSALLIFNVIVLPLITHVPRMVPVAPWLRVHADEPPGSRRGYKSSVGTK